MADFRERVASRFAEAFNRRALRVAAAWLVDSEAAWLVDSEADRPVPA
jgi:hypothetical protein